MSDLPSYVWILVLAGVIGMPAVTAAGLYRGGIVAGLAARTATAVAVTAGVAWLGWIGASALLADAGAYRQDPTTVNPWLGVVFLAVLAVTLLATRIPVVSRVLADPGTPARLAWPHTLRVIGGVFLIVMLLGELPPIFAIPAGIGDIAIGVTAPFVARRLSRGSSRAGAVWFNIMGIVDLAVAVSIGFLAGLGPQTLLDVTPSTETVARLPLALIPTTAVPLAVALHLVSLRRLRAASGLPAAARQPVPAG